MSRDITIDERLMVASASLRRSSPSQWDDFIAALKDHVDQQFDLCVFSPIELLQVAQGRAQHADALLRKLQDYDAADKAIARRMK